MFSQNRRDRLNEKIDIKTLAEEIEGVQWNGTVCHCPWGSDSRPSMNLYQATNTIYCYHCGKKYDVLWFCVTSKHCSMEAASRWLEKHYHIIHFENEDEDEDEDDGLTYGDVTDYFVRWVRTQNLSIQELKRIRVWFWQKPVVTELLKKMDLTIEEFEEGML